MIIWTQTTTKKNFKTPRETANEKKRKPPIRSEAIKSATETEQFCLCLTRSFLRFLLWSSIGIAQTLKTITKHSTRRLEVVEAMTERVNIQLALKFYVAGLENIWLRLRQYFCLGIASRDPKRRDQRQRRRLGKMLGAWRALHSWRAQVGGKCGARSSDSKQIIYGK